MIAAGRLPGSGSARASSSTRRILRARDSIAGSIASAENGGEPRSQAGRKAALKRWANRAPLRLLLAQKVDSSGGPGSCWPWTGGVSRDGYGKLTVGYRTVQAHRAALELKLGRPLGPGEVARHRCVGSRACCNPGHLVPGSVADNNADMVAVGRQARGERAGGVKLTAAQVEEIRRLAADMGHGRFELLGRRFGVTGKTISNIVRGRKWREVQP